MEQVNNIGAKSPHNVSEQFNGEKADNGFVKPKLRIKVPQALSLKNHIVDYEAVDSLHSKLEEETTYIFNTETKATGINVNLRQKLAFLGTIAGLTSFKHPGVLQT
ncbi:unnamed protein product [Arctia plantaginis]|uniref:Uncharacterized protein n=1 Tax=Arctia plantaginis TaxID=874455 RepID=A0A8S1APA3_ARCPL|nr:unnamed protein product [Arctia plantaginis]